MSIDTFDGYENVASTQDHKYLIRSIDSADMLVLTVDLNNVVEFSQNTLFNNNQNKSQDIFYMAIHAFGGCDTTLVSNGKGKLCDSVGKEIKASARTMWCTLMKCYH